MDTSAVILSVAMFYHCEVETCRASACARISRRYTCKREHMKTTFEFDRKTLKKTENNILKITKGKTEK